MNINQATADDVHKIFEQSTEGIMCNFDLENIHKSCGSASSWWRCGVGRPLFALSYAVLLLMMMLEKISFFLVGEKCLKFLVTVSALQKPSNCKLMSSKLISLYTFFSVLALPHRWLSSSTAPRESVIKKVEELKCAKSLSSFSEKLCSFSAPDFVPLILSLETLKKSLFHSSSGCYFYHFLIDTSSTEHPWNSYLACCYCLLMLVYTFTLFYRCRSPSFAQHYRAPPPTPT